MLILLILALWIIVTCFGLFYVFLRWNFNYWRSHKVNGPKPLLYYGNLPNAVTKKRHMIYDIWNIYEDFKHTDDFVGIFKNRTPELLILNPKLAKRVYVTDFKHFHDNENTVMISEKTDFLFANNPFVAGGEKWKEKRSEMLPGITLGRIKAMFPITLEICKRLGAYIEEQIKIPPKDGIDAKDLSSRFMADIIADCVMGLQSDSFKDINSPLLCMQSEMFHHSFVYMTIIGLLPSISKWKKVRFITKQFETYFIGLMEKAIAMRKTLHGTGGERADFLNYLLQLQQKKNLSTMDISAHSMTFLLDGFETVSSVLAHTLLMLARHPLIQQKLREEIQETMQSNKDFDIMHGLPYLDACIHESLRFFPVTFFSRKICTEPIEFTNRNGKFFHVPKGMLVIIPQYPIMMDDEFYENASEFQPERFLEENGGIKKYFDMGVYWSYGDGPRVCLGVRFGFVQIKAALVEILTKFRIKPNPKTRTDYMFDPTYYPARLQGGIYLDFERL